MREVNTRKGLANCAEGWSLASFEIYIFSSLCDVLSGLIFMSYRSSAIIFYFCCYICDRSLLSSFLSGEKRKISFSCWMNIRFLRRFSLDINILLLGEGKLIDVSYALFISCHTEANVFVLPRLTRSSYFSFPSKRPPAVLPDWFADEQSLLP